MIISEPTLRKATIVIRYWWCRSEDCTILHKTKKAAAVCPARNRKALPNHSSVVGPQASDELSVRAKNRLCWILRDSTEWITPEELSHLTPRDLKKIPRLGSFTLQEIIRWMQRHGYWKDWT